MSVRFKNKMLELDGVGKFRFGGEVQFYRMPETIWQDRLEKVAAAGVDTSGCYFGWNFHSARRGEYDFTSPDRDLQRFLDLAHQAGLKIEARPGPYLCNEWDLGGYPGWLLGRDKNWRIGEKNHLAYCAEWFQEVNTILARNQYPNGPIVLYQLENEHFHGDRELYEFLRDEARRNGITVPLISNGGGSVYRSGATGITDGMDMYTGAYNAWQWRGWFDMLYRMLPPEEPMMMLEYQASCTPPWGGAPITDPERCFPTDWFIMETELMMGLGANFVNPFIICGAITPVNFAADTTCTNYAEDSAVTLWGGLNQRFYAYRLLTSSGSSVGEELGESRPTPNGWGTSNSHVEGLLRVGPRGKFLFLMNYASDEQECFVPLAERQLGPVRLRPQSSQLLFADLELTPGLKLDFCSFEVLKLIRQPGLIRLVVHAPRGWQGFLELAGTRLEFTARKEVQRREEKFGATTLELYVVDRETAERTWFAPDGTPVFSNLDLLRPDGVRAELPAEAVLHLELPVEKSARINGQRPEFRPAAPGLHRAELRFPAAPEAEFTFQPAEGSVRSEDWITTEVSAWPETTPWAPGVIQEPDEYLFRTDFEIAPGEQLEELEFPAVVSAETVFYLDGKQLGVFPERRIAAYHQLGNYTTRFRIPELLTPGRHQLAVSCTVTGRHNHGRPHYAGMRVPPVLGKSVELPLTHWREYWGDPTRYDFTRLEAELPKLGGLPARDLDFTTGNFWTGENLESDWMRARHYTATIQLPPELRGGALYCDLGRINWTGVYVNGRYLGETGADHGGWLDLSEFSDETELKIQLAVVNYWNVYPNHLAAAPRLLRFDRRLASGWRLARASEALTWSPFRPLGECPPARQLRYRARVDAVLPPAGEFAAPVYVELDDDWQRHAVIRWNGRAVGRYADVGPDRRFLIPDGTIQPRDNVLEIELDGYAAPARPGRVRFGLYELKRKLELEIE